MSGFWGHFLTWVQVFAIPLLILGNAFFVAAEFALVMVRKTRLEEMVEKKVPGAAVAMEAVKHVDNMVAATQVGITMTSLGLGWVGEPGLARVLEPWFRWLPGMTRSSSTNRSRAVQGVSPKRRPSPAHTPPSTR